jgi:hypothetical protein
LLTLFPYTTLFRSVGPKIFRQPKETPPNPHVPPSNFHLVKDLGTNAGR